MAAVCLILGAGAGVSQSVAKRFAKLKFHVALASRNKSALESLKNEIDSEEGVSIWECDVSETLKIKEVIDQVSRTVGRVEVLIFNAYSATFAKPSELDLSDLNRSMNVNVSAALVAAQTVLPAMKRVGRGTILFTGGGFALYPAADYTALSIGKAGLRALAQCLYQELSPLGIHAATVTICGTVQKGTAFDPDKIAQSFIDLHEQSIEHFANEVMFSGSA